MTLELLHRSRIGSTCKFEHRVFGLKETAMRVRYVPETDALLIDPKDDPVADSEFIEDLGVVVDYNNKGEVVGLEILDWSEFQKEGKELKLTLPSLSV